MKKVKAIGFDHIEDAITDSVEEAANLKLRNQLMDSIIEVVKNKEWTQTEAAKHCGITQPRLNDLMKNKVSKFSLDALVNIAARIGIALNIDTKAA